MLISKQGMVVRVAAKGISQIGRSTQGVRLIQLKADDQLTSIAHVVVKDEEGTGEENGDEAPEGTEEAGEE
jgi:DNA gyrase subunit A